MAEFIRNTHELATLRIRLHPSRQGPQLEFSTYAGTNQLWTETAPASALGIEDELSVRTYRGAHFSIPPNLRDPIIGSLGSVTHHGEPCWIQLGSSAGQLAVLPWEAHLQNALERPLLRIPNFLADPIFLSGPLRAALVVSSPRAKTPFSATGYVRDLVETVQQAVPQGSELHVFTDADAFLSLKELQDQAPPGHLVWVHDPEQEADELGIGSSRLDDDSSAQNGGLQSPWLRWIREATRGEALDLVHFVCPGFFRQAKGALALARSPNQNEDRSWSHFVGAAELIRFLDLVGAWSVGFSPPYENVWAIGLRLLADRLAWQRPGPLFVHDSEDGGRAALEQVYRYLFASDDEAPPRTPYLSLYSHPRRMQRYRTAPVEAYEGAMRRSFGVSDSSTAIPEQLVMLASKADRIASATGTRVQSAWVRANHLQLDRMLLTVGSSDSPSRRGVLDALSYVENVFQNAASLDGTTYSFDVDKLVADSGNEGEPEAGA